MINIGWDNCSPTSDLVADKLGGNRLWDRRPKRLPGVLTGQPLGKPSAVRARLAYTVNVPLAAQVLANGYKLHLGRDDPASGVMHLRHVRPVSCTAYSPIMVKAQGI